MLNRVLGVGDACEQAEYQTTTLSAVAVFSGASLARASDVEVTSLVSFVGSGSVSVVEQTLFGLDTGVGVVTLSGASVAVREQTVQVVDEAVASERATTGPPPP